MIYEDLPVSMVSEVQDSFKRTTHDNAVEKIRSRRNNPSIALLFSYATGDSVALTTLDRSVLMTEVTGTLLRGARARVYNFTTYKAVPVEGVWVNPPPVDGLNTHPLVDTTRPPPFATPPSGLSWLYPSNRSERLASTNDRSNGRPNSFTPILWSPILHLESR
ncbi:hypothetical protein KM043_007073 [Ampulex compressa]|nr:hypothetical protein KM043_007073 [Ampulex compressa]